MRALGTTEVVLRMCDNRQAVVYVMQPWLIRPVDVPCVRREGVRHYRFAQYARGGRIDVWLIPARGETRPRTESPGNEVPNVPPVASRAAR